MNSAELIFRRSSAPLQPQHKLVPRCLMAFERIDIFLPFFVPRNSCGVILVLKLFEHILSVSANQVAVPAYNHVHTLMGLPLLNNNLSWIEGYSTKNVIEFGPLRLGVAVEPLELSEELRLYQIRS